MRVLLAVPSCIVALIVVVALSGCGRSGAPQRSTETSASSTPAPTSTTSAKSSGATTSPGPLAAEAKSAAAGDIPDNQVFIVFRDRLGRYSIKYPEGWAQSGSGRSVVLKDKNNIVRVVVSKGVLPTLVLIRRQFAAMRGVHLENGPRAVRHGINRAVKVVYSTQSGPSPVTGKRVTLVVDRYYLAHGGNEAVVDLGTPQGVDNVDAYRLMIESFRWR